MPQCQNNPGRRFRRCHAPLLLTVIMAVLFAAGSCRRRPQTVAPTGWLATSEPFDSLSRMLDLGFSGDMADDSLRIVCHRFDSAARRSADPMQLNRAAYWRGRMARREGRDSAERLEMQRASPERRQRSLTICAARLNGSMRIRMTTTVCSGMIS